MNKYVSTTAPVFLALLYKVVLYFGFARVYWHRVPPALRLSGIFQDMISCIQNEHLPGARPDVIFADSKWKGSSKESFVSEFFLNLSTVFSMSMTGDSSSFIIRMMLLSQGKVASTNLRNVGGGSYTKNLVCAFILFVQGGQMKHGAYYGRSGTNEL